METAPRTGAASAAPTAALGPAVGGVDGAPLGCGTGTRVGIDEGTLVGVSVGSATGCGVSVGFGVMVGGAFDGTADGIGDGADVGTGVGCPAVGAHVSYVGAAVGACARAAAAARSQASVLMVPASSSPSSFAHGQLASWRARCPQMWARGSPWTCASQPSRLAPMPNHLPRLFFYFWTHLSTGAPLPVHAEDSSAAIDRKKNSGSRHPAQMPAQHRSRKAEQPP